MQNDEPTDEECQTVAMLTGYLFLRTIRINGRKVLRTNYREYLDPVTLEVIAYEPTSDKISIVLAKETLDD